jgi:hypothetical protein
MTNETTNIWVHILNNLIGQLPWVAIAITAVVLVGVLAARSVKRKARRTALTNKLVRGGLPPVSRGARRQMEREGLQVRIRRENTSYRGTSYRRHNYR